MDAARRLFGDLPIGSSPKLTRSDELGRDSVELADAPRGAPPRGDGLERSDGRFADTLRTPECLVFGVFLLLAAVLVTLEEQGILTGGR